MAYGKSVKKNFYSDGKGEIAMPAENELPPVLADNPSDWSGNGRQKDAQPEQEVDQEVSDDQDVSEPTTESHEEEIQEEQEAPKQSSKSSSENLRILREAREKAERERDELMKHILSMQQQQMPKPQVQAQEEEEVNISFEDDALLEGKHGKQLYKKMQQMEKKLAQYESKSSESIIETRIKSELADFDAVVNQENINKLNQEFPEIATTLRDTKDLYSKAVSAYKIMKKFNIYKDKTYDQDKEIALKNASKPRTVTSLNPQQGDSPLSKANAFANGMTKDLQAQLLKEMAEARKNL